MRYKTVKARYYDRITTFCPHCNAEYIDEYPSLWRYEAQKGEQVRCEKCKKIYIIKI